MGKKQCKLNGIGYINRFDMGGELESQTPLFDYSRINTRVDVPNNSPTTPGSIEALSGINTQQQTGDSKDYSGFAQNAGSVIGGVASIAGDVASMSRIKDTSDYSNSYDSYASKLFNGNNNDSLISQYTNQGGLQAASYNDVGGMTHKQRAAGIGKTTLKGAAAGSKFGPWGAVIGAAAGAIAGGVGSIVNHKRAQRRQSQLNNQRMSAFAANKGNLASGIANTNINTFNKGLTNLNAYGGPLSIYSPSDGPIEYEMSYNKRLPKFMQGNNNNGIFAMGGNMSTNGGNFSNGYVEIGTGGTHEENPNQGVQIGVDPQGTPNMVEEGEVIYKDYVFSKRLNANKDLLASVNLPTSYANMSFADIASKLNAKFKETVNDPISKRTLNTNMERLIQAQEEKKQQDAQEEQPMGIIPQEPMINQEQLGMQEPAQDQLGIPQEEIQQQVPQEEVGMQPMMQQQPFAKGGYFNKYDKGSYMNTIPGPIDYEVGQQYSTIDDFANSGVIAEDNNKLANNFFNNSPRLNIPNIEQPSNDPLPKFMSSLNNTGQNKIDDTKDYHLRTFLRYAPVATTGANLAISTLPLDTSGLDKVQKMAGLYTMSNPVSYKPFANYVPYIPVDRNRAIIENNANAAANRRALTNQGNGNRATNAANILASDAQYNKAIGDIAFAGDNINYDRLVNAEKINGDVNYKNSMGLLEADKANAQFKLAGLDPMLKAALAKIELEQWRRSNITGNIGQMGKNLGDIGKERYYQNQLNDLISTGYYGMPSFRPQGMAVEQYNLMKAANESELKRQREALKMSEKEKQADQIRAMQELINKYKREGKKDLQSDMEKLLEEYKLGLGN